MEQLRPKAYSYIRMSTDIQLKGDSLRRQLEASKRYAQKHNLELVQDYSLQDIGVSAYTGENLSSGSFGRFLTAVGNGEIEKGSYFLVESFDRMSRQEPVQALQPFLNIVNSGLILVTLDDERVFKGRITFEDLIISIAKMSRANEESARKSDRLSQAWLNKRNNVGTVKLTARCPSWLRLSADRKSFEIIEERATVVRRIFDDAIAGLGAYSIVRQLNAEKIPTFMGKGGWQTSTVNKTIGGKAAIGVYQPNQMVKGKRQPVGEPIVDYFPRIISDEDFDAAQRSRLSRQTNPKGDRKGSGGRKGKAYSNLFSKLAKCAYCKSPILYKNKGLPPKGYSYLICSSAERNDGCHMKVAWRYDQFETAFLSFVEKLDLASLVSSEKQTTKRSELNRQLEAAEGKLKRLGNELNFAYDTSLRMGTSSDFLAGKIREYELEISATKDQHGKLQSEIMLLADTALTYYDDANQMAQLVEQVRSSNGEAVYKVRTQIATRLQSIIQDLQLLVPTDEKDDQQFEVKFRDGTHMMVFIDRIDPKTVGNIVRSDGEISVVTDAAGNILDRYTLDDWSERGIG